MKLWLNKILFGGKNGQVPYWVANYARYLCPSPGSDEHLAALLHEAENRPDYEYIRQRVDYYCRLSAPVSLPEKAHSIGAYTLSKAKRRELMTFPTETLAKTYFFDAHRILRHFPQHLRWAHVFGDNLSVPAFPVVTKTRPIEGNVCNDVLLNLDRNRHFVFLRDTTPWETKQDRLICRCAINLQPQRNLLFRLYHGAPWCDAGFVGGNADGRLPEQWRGQKISLYDHLSYKFIATFEGNDVASNLKWVMSSNSLAVTNKPRYESWFMEGRLRPDYHYVCVADDLSDLPDKLQYYATHPDESRAILQHAHDYVQQFQDERREFLIAILVMHKYFSLTGQL